MTEAKRSEAGALDEVLAFFDPGSRARALGGDRERADTFDAASAELASLRARRAFLEARVAKLEGALRECILHLDALSCSIDLQCGMCEQEIQDGGSIKHSEDCPIGIARAALEEEDGG